jgi:hypothetical protein
MLTEKMCFILKLFDMTKCCLTAINFVYAKINMNDAVSLTTDFLISVYVFLVIRKSAFNIFCHKKRGRMIRGKYCGNSKYVYNRIQYLSIA